MKLPRVPYGNCLLYALKRFVVSGFKGKIQVRKNRLSRAGCTFYYIKDGVRYHFTSEPKGNMHPWFFKGKVVERYQVVAE